MCVQFSVDLTCVSVYISVYICMLHISVLMYVLVCVCVCQGVHIYVTVSMCRRGVGVSCVLVCRRPWMLSRLQLGTATVPVQCPVQKTARASHLQAKGPYPEDIILHLGQQQHEQAYKLKGHTLKTSTFTLTSSTMNTRAMKQAIDTRMLGCQSEQEVQCIFRFI